MAAVAEKRGVMEAVGVAIGSSDLSSSDRHEKHIDLVAAVGAASARLHYGDQALPIAGAAFRPSGTRVDHIEADLAPKLWHLKAGGQEQTALRLATLFAEWLSYKSQLAEVDARVRHSFAAAVIHEWLNGRCVRCGGTGKLERDRQGRVVFHSNARNARFINCDLCHSSGRGSANHHRRAQCLGIDRQTYDGQGWYRRFRLGLIWLDQIARRLTRPLQIETERRKIAPL